MKSKDKKRRKAKRSINKEFTIISYFFVLIFLSLAGYMVYFNVVKREDVINSPYNTRQNQFQERILRGSILSADGQVLARTDTDGEGNETRVYPFANMYAHVVGYDTKGKSGVESLANFSLMTSHNNYVDQVKNEILEKRIQEIMWYLL